MAIHRLKNSFTAGELSPMMYDRVDFDRYKNGCKKLYNAVCSTQGPAVRRPGTRFVYDLNSLGLDTSNPLVRHIPFIFNKDEAYVFIFYMHTDGNARIVFGASDASGVPGLVTYGDPAITECPPGTPVTPTPGEIVTVTLPAGWDIEGFDWAQSGDEMYFVQSGLQPHILIRHDSGGECWELLAKTFTDEPAEWESGTTGAGWPERVTFHQQRLVFAANTLKPQTVWMTEAGDFDSFSINSPLLDSDAVTFTLDSGTQNKIKWMVSGKTLNIGTLGNEWTVQGNDQSALTPDNILAQRQTNSGSEPNKPLLVGITTLFVERHGRTVNEFVYDYTYDSYKTSDMAILSPHVTEKYSIVDWSYQRTPDSIIWCIREDGDLLGITYQRQHKVVGWHHHDTRGEFKAITVIPGNTREDDLWFTVMRMVGGQPKYYVERMEEWFKEEEAEWGRFLDSHLTYYGAPASTIYGLEHLEGDTVDVLADGTVHPECIVTSGEITLNNDYSHVVVGLPYTTEIRPTLPDVSTRTGTSLSRVSRITDLSVDFYRTLGCYIGKYDQDSGETEEEIPFRKPGDLTGTAVPLFTGWMKMDFLEGFGVTTEYFVRQKQPLPLTIRAMVDAVEVFE